MPKLAITLERAGRSLAKLRCATTWRPRWRPACRRPTTGRPFPTRSDTVVSPRVAAIYHFTDRVSGWGDFGLGFRAPTLNELYRQFSVGAVITRANDQLGPERLDGGEARHQRRAGAERHRARRRGSTTASRIRCRTSRLAPTCSSGRTSAGRASGASRPTSNTASARSGGFPAAYLYNQAKVEECAANPALVGKYPGAGARSTAARCRSRMRIRGTRPSRSAFSSSAGSSTTI